MCLRSQPLHGHSVSVVIIIDNADTVLMLTMQTRAKIVVD